MDKVYAQLKDTFILLKSPGKAHIIINKTLASSLLRIQDVDDNEIDDDAALALLSKKISKEIKELPQKKGRLTIQELTKHLQDLK